MRRLLTASLALTLLAAACGEQSPSSEGVAPRADLGTPALAAAACPSVPSLQALIPQLYGGTAASRANTDLNFIVSRLALGTVADSAAARTRMFSLLDFSLKRYYANGLIGGKSATTQANLTAFTNGLYCITNTQGQLPPLSLDPDGAAQVITPTSPPTTIVTGTKWAGITIQTGQVPTTTLITIRRLPNTPGPLLTQFDQYPLYYEFDASPAVTFNSGQVIGVCQAANVLPPDPSRLRIAHNVAPFTFGSIEVLPAAPAPFLDCSNAPIALDGSAGLRDLARASWRALTGRLEMALAPAPLYASAALLGGGVGGTVRNFSPFGAIDTLGVITPNSPTTQNGAVGSPVGAPPSVMVKTPTGAPMPGITVNFAVTGGGGSATGASAVTDANGVATVGSWTLGLAAGANTLAATAAGPLLTGFQGNPVGFTATGQPAASLRFLTQPGNTTVGAPFSPAVQVAVTDVSGNIVRSDNSTEVRVVLTGFGSSLTGTRAAVAVNGVVTFTGLAVTRTGTGLTLTATSSPALGSVTSTPFNVQ